MSIQTYMLNENKTLNGAVDAVTKFLRLSKNMDTQILTTGNGRMIQARTKGGKFKQFIGLDKALTVKINSMNSNELEIEIGEGKWVDKGVVLTVSMFVLWPLAVTSGVGIVQQIALQKQVEKEIAFYLSA